MLAKYNLLSLQKEIIDLQLKFIDSRDHDFRKRAWADMQEISKLIRFILDEKGLLYSEANAFDNIVNLGLKYLEQQPLELTDFVFLTEVLNHRLGTVEEGFYPMLDMKRHGLDRNNNEYLIRLDFNLRAETGRTIGVIAVCKRPGQYLIAGRLMESSLVVV